ncbi:MAG: hypothetical protein U0T56_12220 [Ferruginibacter sp.]
MTGIRNYWVNGTKTINYAIDSLWQEGDKALLRLKRIGAMPMPVAGDRFPRWI